MEDNEPHGEAARMEKSQDYVTSDTSDDYPTSGGIESKYF